MIKKIFSIKDMHCSSCAMMLEGIEDELPGIKYISASYQKQILSIEFDEHLVNEDQIKSAITNLGYHIEID